MATSTFIGKEALEEIANKYSSEIMLSGVYFRAETLDRLKIKVIQGVEYVETINVMQKRGRTTRRKIVGKTLQSQAGYLEERKLYAVTVWNRFMDNKDNYVEERVINTLGTNDSLSYPASELAFKVVKDIFGQDLYNNLWHGNADHDPDSELGWLGLYNGFITNLYRDLNLGKINSDLGNYVELDAITIPVLKDDFSAWTTFETFIEAWDPLLKTQPEILVYCSPQTRLAISKAYTIFHNSYKEPEYSAQGTKFNEYPAITLIDEPSFGKGDKMIATIPYNFVVGVDTLTSKEVVSVKIGSDKDNNDITFQLQTIMGTRVDLIGPTTFCMSDGSLLPVSLSGDYQFNSITATSANTAQGTVAKSDAKTDYAVGDTVTLTATPAEGFVFDEWTDGVKTAVREVIGIGQPLVFIAKFKAA